MRFSEHLSAHLTPEWRKQYIQYDAMKETMYEAAEAAPAVADSEERDLHFENADVQFFSSCTNELSKVNLFYAQQIADAAFRSAVLDAKLKTSYDRIMGLYAKRKMTIQNVFRKQSEQETGELRNRKKASSDASAMVSVLEDPVIVFAALKNHPKVLESLRKAYSELYLHLILIQNYQELNFTGFRKILKKHDKVFSLKSGMEWYRQNVVMTDFARDTRIDQLLTHSEKVYTEYLEGGNRNRAMDRLRVPPLSEKTSIWVTFRLGVFIGCFSMILVAACFSLFFHKNKNEPAWVAVRLFRGFFIIFVNILLVGINLYGWQRAGVNNVLIFELDPRDHMTFQNILELSFFFLSLGGCCVLGYQYHSFFNIPRLAFPIILAVFFFGWLFNPIPIGYYTARKWMLKKIGVLLTPLTNPVLFADFWLADQLNSLTTFLLDMEYFACFYIMQVDWANGFVAKDKQAYLDAHNLTNTAKNVWAVDYRTGDDMCNSSVFSIRPIISLIPAAMRFFQCVRRYADTGEKHPHLTNAGKYSTTFFVVLFAAAKTWFSESNRISSDSTSSPMFYIWLLAYTVSTCYTYTWDVKMDWGLGGTIRNSENPYLRKELVYPHKSVYYMAIIMDLFLRLSWTMNLSLNDFWFFQQHDLLVCVTAFLECFRRFMWNFFRLENEHLNNCGDFRAVRDIAVHVMPRDAENKRMQQQLAKRDSSGSQKADNFVGRAFFQMKRRQSDPSIPGTINRSKSTDTVTARKLSKKASSPEVVLTTDSPPLAKRVPPADLITATNLENHYVRSSETFPVASLRRSVRKLRRRNDHPVHGKYEPTSRLEIASREDYNSTHRSTDNGEAQLPQGRKTGAINVTFS